jgi:hypothetical protein
MTQVQKVIRVIFSTGTPTGPYAFRIMKTAYDNDIRGECRYTGINELLIHAEGEESKIDHFIIMLNEILPDSSIDAWTKDQFANFHYKEFDIIPTIQYHQIQK